MKSLVIIVGSLLMVVAFVVLFGLIVIPTVVPSFKDAPIIGDTFQTLFCKPHETIADARQTYHPEPGKTVTTLAVSCVDSEGKAREVDSQVFTVGLVGFLGPFLVGLFMVIIGANRKQKSVYTQSFTQPLGQGFSTNAAGIDIKFGENGEVIVKTPDGRVRTGHQMQVGTMGNMASMLSGAGMGGAESLTERLKELKNAFDSGLISQSEYDDKRQQILKEM